MLLDLNDSDVYAALAGFIGLIVPGGTPIQKGQINRVPMPSVPCVILTTIGAPRRIGTNEDTIQALVNWTSDDNVTADSTLPNSGTGFNAMTTADFEYSVQADFYSPDAESWAIEAELLWRSKFGWSFMPEGIKPLYSEGRQQLPIVGAENQWIQRWTMTLVLDYQPTFSVATQAATTATVVPEPIDVFYPAR